MSNRLTTWQQLFYRYDAWGNLVSRRHGQHEQHYAYDADNRLIRARGRGPEGEFTAHYHYDALGRRVRKTVDYRNRGTETTRFLWQGYRLLQEQRDNATRRTWSYDPASPWAPLAAIEQAGNAPQADIYWLHTDLNSAPLEVTDADGNLRWSGQYDTFGELRGQTPGSDGLRTSAAYAQPLRFAGQYQDNESGLHYNLFRYYEPEVGRFTTQDPIGLAGGWNLYQYAPNPYTCVDPLGLMTLYRGMSLDEFNSLMSDGWKAGEGTMEGKWFAESYKDAVTWGNRMGHGGETFKVVQVEVPDNVANNMHIDPHLDGIGPARYADLEDLNNHGKITWSKEVKARGSCSFK